MTRPRQGILHPVVAASRQWPDQAGTIAMGPKLKPVGFGKTVIGLWVVFTKLDPGERHRKSGYGVR